MKKLLFISIFAALVVAGCSENPGSESENGGIGSGDNTEQEGNGNNGGQEGDDDEGSGVVVSGLQKYILGHWRWTRLEWRFDESEDGGVFHSENAPFAITVYFASSSPESAVVLPHIVSRGDDYELDEGQVIIGYENRYMVFNADGTAKSEVQAEYLPEYADREEYGPEDEDMTYTLSGDRVVMYDSEGYSFDFHAEMTKDEDGVDCLVFRYTSDSPTENQPWTMQNLYFKRQ